MAHIILFLESLAEWAITLKAMPSFSIFPVFKLRLSEFTATFRRRGQSPFLFHLP